MFKEWVNKVSEKDRQVLLNMSEEEKNDSFYTSLSFGTAGIRGRIGLGPNRMNYYQVTKVISGYAEYLKSVGANAVAIAHDNRLFSREFTLLSVNILKANGIEVYAFDTLAPTPLLSYVVRELELDGGVIITASHNPKEYNGIKLYDKTGCQITPDKIVPIIDAIDAADYFESYKDATYKQVPDSVVDKYVTEVQSIKLRDVEPIKATFTPLHGTAGVLIDRVLPGLDLVTEQMVADGHFSTCEVPNPESTVAFELALKYARENDSEVVLATDPDADRVGIMVKHEGEYVYLNGNESAVLLLNYILESKPFENGIVYKSIVTGNLGKRICEAYGIEMEETLTGFKYIGTRMNESEKTYVFGYEESNGCIIKDIVRDKDSLQAVFMLYEAASFYKAQGLTLLDKLDEIYKKYGYFYNTTISFSLEGQEGAAKKARVMEFFRTHSFDGLLNRIDFLGETGLPKDDIVKLVFDSISLIVRPSGTEPKVKVYMEAIDDETLVDTYKTLVSDYIEKI